MPAKLVVVAHLEGRFEVSRMKAPEPDSSVRREASSEEVSIEVDPTLLLNNVQSAEARQPKAKGEEVEQVSTPPEFESPEPVRSEKYSEFKPSVPPTLSDPVVEAEEREVRPWTVKV